MSNISVDKIMLYWEKYQKERGCKMGRILGTILLVGNFFKKEKSEVKIDCGTEPIQFFSLLEGRKYIIPDYQREIRWKKENLIELMTDISQGPKFLGNIILNKRNSLEYEVIDGQQRITTLSMIISYINYKYHEELNIFETCKLEMDNFSEFNLLMKNNFNSNNLNSFDKELIEESDIFNQRERYEELWNVFDEFDSLQYPGKCRTFLSNLKESQMNLIVNTNENDNNSINHFMDVNLKGVKLDTEDIFKGYLFSQDREEDIREQWKIFKVESFKLNKLARYPYPTTKLLEHYFYCDLYKNEMYKDIQLREDFTISELVIVNGEKHYKGEHLIKVIQNNSYLLQSIKNINRFLEIITDVMSSGESPSLKFKSLFKTSDIDDIEIKIIHNFTKKVMLDKNIVPKILIMKYVLEVLLEPKDEAKREYRKIYGMYLLAVIFTIFEGEKDIKKVAKVVKDKEWYDRAVEQSRSYFSLREIPKSKITVQYKLLDAEDDVNYMFRCKSLATIYNYFEIRDNFVEIKKGKKGEVLTYISDSNKFSNEHFIVNNGGGYKLNEKSKIQRYSSDIKKYANSLFNFVFISKDLNQKLENRVLWNKIRFFMEEGHIEEVECEYSRMIVGLCKCFTNPTNLAVEDEEDVVKEINSYYEGIFTKEFSNYASKVIENIENRLEGGLDFATSANKDQVLVG